MGRPRRLPMSLLRPVWNSQRRPQPGRPQALQLHELSMAQLKQLISRLGGEEAVPELVIEKRELVGLATQLLSQVLTLACA